MKIAIMLLCHDAPLRVVKTLATPFYDSPDVKLYVHYDARRSADEAARLQAALATPGRQVQMLGERLRCAWGSYSLVQATQRLMQTVLADTGFAADYLLLISGSCVPIRPLASLQAFLRRRQGMDFIEAVDASRRRWVKDGLEHERYQFYFPFNYQTQRRWFEWFTAAQRRLGVHRATPAGLRIHLGSQWFCLTRATAAAVCAQLERRDLQAFFAHAWIPDELAIQTLVAAHRPAAFIAGHSLTYGEFDHRGQPLELDNGHLVHLLRQPYFFARKISPHASQLRDELIAHVGSTEADFSYFDHVGQPTAHYQTQVARALTAPALRSRVGALCSANRPSVMALSQRPYYVLHATSAGYLLALTRAARRIDPALPIFDFLFEPSSLIPAAEHGPWFGLQSSMCARRDYDPAGFLHEAVHASAVAPAAFALDAARPSWVREYCVTDPHATIVDCDPPGLGKMQLAEAALSEARSYSDPTLLSRTVQAAHGSQRLPQQHFEQVREGGKHDSHFMLLYGIPDESPNAMLRALKAAMQQVPVADHYREACLAETRIRGAFAQD
ncbi:MAG: beta-1,6-N-acetylglucosaminyltransferase [Proteobacteria bacterium]|nr:beta-1,6-N-acetylglucosaminyltransferase [Pseudomonadota bacterium]